MTERDLNDLHERIDKAMCWAPGGSKGFSLATLQEFMRTKDAALARELAEIRASGRHLFIEPDHPRRSK